MWLWLWAAGASAAVHRAQTHTHTHTQIHIMPSSTCMYRNMLVDTRPNSRAHMAVAVAREPVAGGSSACAEDGTEHALASRGSGDTGMLMADSSCLSPPHPHPPTCKSLRMVTGHCSAVTADTSTALSLALWNVCLAPRIASRAYTASARATSCRCCRYIGAIAISRWPPVPVAVPSMSTTRLVCF